MLSKNVKREDILNRFYSLNSIDLRETLNTFHGIIYTLTIKVTKLCVMSVTKDVS